MNTKELEKVFERFCACCPAPAGTDWTIHKTKATGRYFYYLATKDGAGVVQPAVAQVFYLSEMAAFLEGMMAYRELYGVVKKKR